MVKACKMKNATWEGIQPMMRSTDLVAVSKKDRKSLACWMRTDSELKLMLSIRTVSIEKTGGQYFARLKQSAYPPKCKRIASSGPRKLIWPSSPVIS